MTRTGVLRRMCIVVLSVATVAIPAIGQRASAAPSAGGATIHHGKLVSPKSSLPARDLPRSSPGKHQAVPRFQIPRATAKPAGGNHASRPSNTTMPAPSVTFKGLDFNAWGAGWPPDPVGDVGPNHYVQAVNTSIGIFSKTGTQLAAFTFDSLWSTAGTGTACDAGNPATRPWSTTRWPTAGSSPTSPSRAHGSAGPYYECIAVSKTSDPVTGGWYFYPVRTDDASHPWFADYPKMGDLARRPVHDGQHVPGLRLSRRCAAGRSTAPTSSRARRFAHVIVDLATIAYFGLLPSNLRGYLAPGRAGEPLRHRIGRRSSPSSVQVPRRLQRQRLDLHRPDERQPDLVHRRHPRRVPSPGNNLDSLHERLMMQAPVPEHRRYRVALGQPHGQDVPVRADRDPVGPDQRHRRHRRHHPGAAADLRQRRQ